MRVLPLLALVACSHPAPTPAQPPGPGSGSAAPIGNVTADAPAPSEDEKLAAIQKAMNELDEGAQACWAMAATDRFDIAGKLEIVADISPSGAKTEAIDHTGSPKLVSCMTQLLARYRWAPPLYGQAIKLPFEFKQVDGQSVIDRRLVETKIQGSTSVAVLLDGANTGNAAASMFEVGIAARGSTGMRVDDRDELWYFLGDAEVKSRAAKGQQPTSAMSQIAKAGSMMFVPKGAAREVIAKLPDFKAVVAIVPGGVEGVARGGALPAQQAVAGAGSPAFFAQGTKYGPATIFVEAATLKGTPLAASILELPAGAKVPEHVHASETEMLYVLEGSGTMTIAGQEIAVSPTSVIQIPPNTKHAFAASANVRALQIYTPPGPEQRFKKK